MNLNSYPVSLRILFFFVNGANNISSISVVYFYKNTTSFHFVDHFFTKNHTFSEENRPLHLEKENSLIVLKRIKYIETIKIIFKRKMKNDR